MEPIKCRKGNVSARFIGAHFFRKFRKCRILENFDFLKISKEEFAIVFFVKKHSTSPPCGNLVDGLPHDCHTETIAKPARLGPAKNDTTLEFFIELLTFWWITLRKVHRKRCRAYIED